MPRKPDQPGGDPDIHAPNAVPAYADPERGELREMVFGSDGVMRPRYTGDKADPEEMEKDAADDAEKPSRASKAEEKK